MTGPHGDKLKALTKEGAIRNGEDAFPRGRQLARGGQLARGRQLTKESHLSRGRQLARGNHLARESQCAVRHLRLQNQANPCKWLCKISCEMVDPSKTWEDGLVCGCNKCRLQKGDMCCSRSGKPWHFPEACSASKQMPVFKREKKERQTVRAV